MSKKPKLGLIGTGQGPRSEYIAFHSGMLRRLGLEVDVVMRHALHGMSAAEIQALAPKPEDPAIHGYVRVPGEMNHRFGADWGEVWMERGRSIGLVQACIDALEKEDGVDATIYCCAEPYPKDAFRCSRPLVLPYRVALGYAEAVAHSRGGKATIGILTGGTRQRKQQLEMWHSYPWTANLNLQFELVGEAPGEAAKRLAETKPDLVIYWGYGIGLAPGDPPGLISEMEAILGRPIILGHIVSTLFVRSLLYPSINGREFV
jgi:protein AroM